MPDPAFASPRSGNRQGDIPLGASRWDDEAARPGKQATGAISMITEIAHITIDPANTEAFEAGVAEAAAVLLAADGSHAMTLERVIEHPGQYRLRVQWDSVDHHMVTFRQSDGFRRWRELAGPFFVETPVVEHTELVGQFF
jgi:quinol monooxygenase YgiN